MRLAALLPLDGRKEVEQERSKGGRWQGVGVEGALQRLPEGAAALGGRPVSSQHRRLPSIRGTSHPHCFLRKT